MPSWYPCWTHKLPMLLPAVTTRSHCLRARRPIRPALISGFRSTKRLGLFLLPPGWDASPSQGYPQHFNGTHLYTWVERGTVRVKCLAQEQNTMSPARTRTRTTQSGVQNTNHEATVPPTRSAKKKKSAVELTILLGARTKTTSWVSWSDLPRLTGCFNLAIATWLCCTDGSSPLWTVINENHHGHPCYNFNNYY